MIEILSDLEDPEECVETPETQAQGQRARIRRYRVAAGEPVGIVLCDPDEQLARFWEHAFEGCPGVSVRRAAPSELVVDALVIPSSYAGRVNESFERSLLVSARNAIERHVLGLLRAPVTERLEALVIPIGDRDCLYLIPVTMPERAGPLTAQRATKTALLAAAKFNADNPDAIRSVAFPNLFPGAELNELATAAWEMRRAIEEFREVE